MTRLRKSGNPNASDNSSHCYGTTFDISHSRYSREVETDEFMQPYELTKVLAEVLRDERNGRWLLWYNGRNGGKGEYIGLVLKEGLDLGGLDP